MKAIVQERYGAPDVLTLRDVPVPQPGADEVRVRVHAASVNAYDWHVLRGDPRVMRLISPTCGLRGPKRPIRGRDFAGRVTAVGSAVTLLRVGDEVYGDLGEADGAFAEYVCAPAELVDIKPAGLTFEQAAAVPLAGITALMGLRDVGQVRPGQQVLINGASGGVGTFAVQLAKAFGAQVTGVCSTRNAELVRSLGADDIVDYTREDFAANGKRYDIVFDLVANRSLGALKNALRPEGVLVISGGGVFTGGSFLGPIALSIKGQLAARFGRVRARQLMEKPGRDKLATLRELIESGSVRPVIDRTYPLDRAPDAIRYLESEHARAKVVLTV
ncbi:NAD(P)-dependent alcohol dehydrogenase [Nocardia arthritidis]|uniref:Zinc-binding dehydrogenase n=1 Tax=Nocardia arthritidis TaxID=228602 RepID=A0A6G9Y9R8_9NOCA|nr:NAD(P)-dependent alcohol dehydrogenase [Nocardia arthritidis]QIS09961.1 zinc-binding dehydrogenase [Nocardia arthritidis]